MIAFLNTRVFGVMIVGVLWTLPSNATAQTSRQGDLIEKLLAQFKKEREAADWPANEAPRFSACCRVWFAESSPRRKDRGDLWV